MTKGPCSGWVVCTSIVVDSTCGWIAVCGIVHPKLGEHTAGAGVMDFDPVVVFRCEAVVGVFCSKVAGGG